MKKTAARNASLKQLLVDYRRSMLDDVQVGIRNRRTDWPTEVRDDIEHADADASGEISIALLQMRADTLTRIDQALARLAVGVYGSCIECDGDISAQRLRALPFAERCQACQAGREQLAASQQRARPAAHQPMGSQGAERFIAARFDGWAR
jgi:DnaK suppressor protein